MNSVPTPGPALLLAVRAAFVSKGSSLSAWCVDAGIDRAAARLALLGAWNGPKGQAMRVRIVGATGLNDGAENA